MRHWSFASAALLLGLASAHAQDLMLGSFATRAHTIVYELPGVPPDEVRILTSAMKQKFPQAELIDAGENQLREKLKKSFLLITLLSPDSRLLPLVA
jgi:hypothetical protein